MMPRRRRSLLVLAYTNYESDPRVIRAAEAARQANFTVDVIALRRPGQPPAEMVRGVRVFRVAQRRYRGRSRLRYLLAYLAFAARCAVRSTALLATQRYAVVHVNNMPDPLVFSLVVPKLLGARIILDIHDPMPETFDAKFAPGGARTVVGRLLLLLERASVGFADLTITVSEPLKQGILASHGYRPEAIGVVANLADDALFTPRPYPPIDGRIRFVFHGTILERYGLRTLIEAVAQVRHRDRLRVTIIGEGDFSATLSDLIRSHGVGDVVEFINRVYPVQDIPGLLAGCHAGVVPLNMSHLANFALPLKLLEYTCLGLPSITVRNAAIAHYWRPDECLYFTAGDARQLASLLDMLAEHPGRLLEYRERLTAARNRLLWSNEKTRYIAMLEDLVHAHPTAGAVNRGRSASETGGSP
jgi:glycosyltransferase involved in cell wall biosynthesis